MKTCIFIPTWNVGRQAARVLERIPPDFGRACAEVFVLDNASTDDTVDAILDRLRQGLPFPVRVYRNPINRGYGGSQKAAFAHALRRGYDVVAMLHGDGQYPAERLPALVRTLEESGAALASGSRLLFPEEMDETPFFRRWGVQALTFLQNLASGLKLSEWFSGFRAFRCDALREVPFQACADDYYFDVQIILLLSRAGGRIAEMPVAKKYEGIRSPVNVYRFAGKVLARMPHYPLARCGLLPGKLYRPRHWAALKKIEVPAPVEVKEDDPEWERQRAG